MHNALYNGIEITKEPLNHLPSFLVTILATDRNKAISYCTGVALATDVILTAGHCLVDAQTVAVKPIQFKDPSTFTTIKGKAWKIHPKFNGEFPGKQLEKFSAETADRFHDIGLVILSAPSNDLEPITIAPSSFNPAGSTAWMFVFGQARDKNYVIQDKFGFGELQNTQRIGTSSLYVANLKGEQGWCVRDSGGPVTVGGDGDNGEKRHYLLGIAFAHFSPVLRGDRSELKRVWGDLEKVPTCGSRVGYSIIGEETAWIEATLKVMLPSQSRSLLYFK